jgi:hypothetical protein
MLAKERFIFKCGCTHFYAELFRFLTTRDHASIVVAQYNERTADQAGIENPLAGGVKIITINEGKVHRGWWMT